MTKVKRRSPRAPKSSPNPPRSNFPPVEVAPGIFRLELPMPFELRHVNVYLLRDGDGFTLIDTGLQTQESRETLNRKLDEMKLPVERINRILIRHIHPDHFGRGGGRAQPARAVAGIHRPDLRLSGG